MNHKILVLDTSLFVNPDAARAFGASPTAAVTGFLEMASRVSSVEFLMPPSIYSELMHFAEEPKIPKTLLLTLKTRPPKKHEIKVPGYLLYELVDDMRDRVDRGLRLAERVSREALQVPPMPPGPSDPKKVRPDAELISRLRESYRRIMREGSLDSRCDVDLLLLAYETNGTLVSADQGVVMWAEKLGVTILDFQKLYDFLTQHASTQS